MPAHSDLQALRNLIKQAHLIVSSNPLPPGGRERAAELLQSAVALSGALVDSKRTKPAAAVLGAKGGKETAKRGPEYFSKIAAMRKTRSGGAKKK
jgi:hypothetical protein